MSRPGSTAPADTDRPGVGDDGADVDDVGGAEAGRRPTIGTSLWLLAMAWGAGVATFSLTDNSFLTHLATGRIILDDLAVPSADPYTFTARGTDWTVQSWLASVVYATAEQLGGVVGLRVVVLAFFVGGAWLLWKLSEPCESLIPRIAIVFGALFVVTQLWSERPYMVGVLGLGLVWLTLAHRLPPWTLVPIFWVWANSHGSFPLGLALIGAVLVGRRLDGDTIDHETRVLGIAVVGTLVAAIGPLGPRVLLFPLTALTRSDLLTNITEWQPPGWQSETDRVFLVLAVATVLSLVARPSWARALPAVLFLAAAVVAQRNIVMAVMVFVPVLAGARPTLGRLTVSARPTLIRPYVAVGVVALLVGTLAALRSDLGSLERYPAAAVAWIEETPVRDEPMATRDVVGNFLEGLDGEEADAFFDDRIDMLPRPLIEDSLVLFRGGREWERVLDDYGIKLVVWDTSAPLAAILAEHEAWRVVFSDPRTMVACRRGPTCAALEVASAG